MSMRRSIRKDQAYQCFSVNESMASLALSFNLLSQSISPGLVQSHFHASQMGEAAAQQIYDTKQVSLDRFSFNDSS